MDLFIASVPLMTFCKEKHLLPETFTLLVHNALKILNLVIDAQVWFEVSEQ